MNIEQKTPAPLSFLRHLLKIVCVAGVYFLFAHLGLYLATLNSVASPVWPATGIALFFILLWGPQMALGVFAGAVAANYFTAAPLFVILGIGIGNSLEALTAIWFYHRLSIVMERLGPYSKIVVYVAVSTFATAISASIGTGFSLWGQIITFETARVTWLTWWVGDTLGALILFPLAVKICQREFKPFSLPPTKIPQLVLVALVTLGLGWCVFVLPSGAPFLFSIFPVLLLTTIWFSSSWVYLVSIVICIFAILSTKMGLGPFYGGNLNENLLHLQLFLAGVGMTAIVLVTLQKERSLKIPSLALVFGWILTGLTFYSFYQASVDNDREHFRFQVEKAERDLQDSLDSYVRLLETGSGLFAASETLTREEWRAFAERLRFESQYPGANGIGIIVPIADKAAENKLISFEKSHGALDFKLHEIFSAPDEKKVKDPPLTLAVKYIEPMSKNRSVVGLLVSSEEHRLTAALKARDTGMATMTDRITLVQDKKLRPGFVLYVPLYERGMPLETVEQRRKAFQGLVFSPIIVEKFIRATLGKNGLELDLKIHFGRDQNKKSEVFSSGQWDTNDRQTIKSNIRLAEMPVTLQWKRGQDFKTQSSTVASWAGFCGALISIFLAIVLSSLENITERAQKIAAQTTYELSQREKELQQRQMALVASSRMSSLGQMASGMAHEINNPLAIISGKAQHLERLLNEQPLNIDKVHQHIQVINANVERIAKIIRGLRSIARDVPDDPFREVRAKDIMQDTLELCRSRFKHHEVQLIVPTDISPEMVCYVRPEQIVQVLLNLLNNAFDAVIAAKEKWVRVTVEQVQGKIYFAVEDSGQGLSADLSEKIFDPFFTTKEVGKGTGLGLSISRGIVEKHRGRLYIDNQAVHTKFVVELESRGTHAKENSYS